MSVERFDCTGKVALITGGGGLLGREHALALTEIGARVVVADINLTNAQKTVTVVEETFGPGALAIAMDITSKDSIESARLALEKRDLKVDILVNNAAVNPQVSKTGNQRLLSRFENFSLEAWNLEVSVGLTGAFLCSQVFGVGMAQRKHGVILNIASDLSVIAPDNRLYRQEGIPDDEQPVKPVTYSVVKTGLLGLTRYLAAYWAACNVRVNALSPGGVQVDQPDEFVAKLSHLIPLGRMARSDEYRGALQFLCSNASSYLTGQNIVIDGGRTIL